jgi:predicted HicB family RNase H-like nuclease
VEVIVMDEEITIDLTKEELLLLAIKAHDENITLNQLINDILRKYMDTATL